MFHAIQRLALQLLWVFVILASGYVMAAERTSDHLIVSPQQDNIDLNPYVQMTLEFADSPLSELLQANPTTWKTPKNHLINAGANTTVWAKVALRVQGNGPQSRILEIPWSVLKTLDWYVVEPHTQRILSQGQIEDWQSNQDILVHDRYTLPIQLPADSLVDLYIRASGPEKVIVPLALLTPDHHRTRVQRNSLFSGLFYGAMLAMLCYNFSLFVFIRDRNYAIYCVYVATIILYTLTFSGVGSIFLWGDWQWLNGHVYRFSVPIAFLAASVFIRTFLSLSKHGGFLLILSNITIAFWLITFALIPILPNGWIIIWIDVLGFISCFMGLGISGGRWYKGDPSGKYMTLAWGLLILSTFVLMLGLTDVIPYSKNLYYIQNLGFVFEVIMLSMALAERINRERQSLYKAQASALYYEQESRLSHERELMAQQRTLDVERDAKEQLERKVDEQTSELKLALYSLSQANQDLELMSQTDGLTQLTNRYAFDKRFAKGLEKAIDSQWPIAVFMLDIDFFKKVNDQYGHLAGDECLRQLARQLQSFTTNEQDLCARYGGEEFTLVLLNQNREVAQALAEAIRNSVACTPITYEQQTFFITISIGVHVETPDLNSHPDTLLKIADEALYQAKANGRNCVEIH